MRPLLLALVVLLVGATSAQAQVNNQSVASDGLLYSAVEVADQFWADHGQQTCKGTIYDYDEGTDEGVVARATIHGCEVYFDRAYVKRVRSELRRYGPAERRETLKEICMVAIHERGHNLGLDHDKDDKSLMAPVIGGHPTVGRCIAWAIKHAPGRSRHGYGVG
jgi:hypothetical protein